MNNSLLEIKNLNITYSLDDKEIRAVKNLNLTLKKGRSLGIIGESGSGKTSLALSILKLLDSNAMIEGSIIYNNTDLYKITDDEINQVRWDKISIVFQNSLDVLNPLLTIEDQILEVLFKNGKYDKDTAKERVIYLLEQVGLNDYIKDFYPHQLSGGMRQKVLIAMGISCNPEILIVDEPTSSLDYISKMEIIELLNQIKKKEDITLIVISHQIDTVMKLTEEMIVLYQGLVLEKGNTMEIIDEPLHMYTRGLLNSSPEINPYSDLWGIPGIASSENGGCPFQNRCTQAIELCKKDEPKLQKIKSNRYISCNQGGIKTILYANNINKKYKNNKKIINACKDISLEIKTGEVISLIGESGSGKTTLASILAGIIEADSGDVYFYDDKVLGNNFTRVKNGIQMVFQDPYSSINENLTIEEAIIEPLIISGYKDDMDKKIESVLEVVRLPNKKDFLYRKVKTLSGGQRQRLAIARSLTMEPKLLIADEISSMLDLSTQANIIRLLKEIQNMKGFSMLYVTHDLALARKISDRIYIIQNGEIIEHGSTKQIFQNPKKQYSKKLLSAIDSI